MLLSETGFTYNGVHSRRDMGLLYAEKDGHIVIPEIRRNNYAIAGMSGTVQMPGESWQPFNLEGTLYPAEEPRTQAQAQRLLRRVSAWLTAGRKKLVFDYEPTVYYLAELSAASKWSLRNWFGGELPIRFQAQPYAYAVEPSGITADVTTGTSYLTITVETGAPAPVELLVENTGTAVITRVDLDDYVWLRGISLGVGQTLTVSMEPPCGAEIAGASALPYADRFRPMELGAGAHTVSLFMDFGGGLPGARVTLRARGRW